MNKLIKRISEGVQYMPPQCEVIHFQCEGILCASGSSHEGFDNQVDFSDGWN